MRLRLGQIRLAVTPLSSKNDGGRLTILITTLPADLDTSSFLYHSLPPDIQLSGNPRMFGQTMPIRKEITSHFPWLLCLGLAFQLIVGYNVGEELNGPVLFNTT